MFLIDAYLDRLTGALRRTFGERLLYVGLQGSWLRGEATPDSDIDVMVVLEELGLPELEAYRGVLAQTGEEERACGFLCGREELARWNPLELCHLRHTTRGYYGTLDGLLPQWTREDEQSFVRLGLGNLYHLLGHSFVHAGQPEREALLREGYKSAFFLLQNLHYLETGDFLPDRRTLRAVLSGSGREVLEAGMGEIGPEEYRAAFARLFGWCREAMAWTACFER